MAKSQKRSNREIRKPKAAKEKRAASSISPPHPVNALMQRPTVKL
jgi:hypothetical protein